jgi:DNA-directed RNA polymerase specialized sigma24 family protein
MSPGADQLKARMTNMSGGGRSKVEDFRSAYELLLPRLVRLAHLITGSNSVAEDVVHDVFVAAYRRWDDVQDPEGYLYRSVVNRSRSVLRRRAVELSRVREPVGVVLPPEIDEAWAALQAIPIRRRTALVLRYYADLPVDAIAEIMNARPGTVRSLIHRGHESLRKVLEQ